MRHKVLPLVGLMAVAVLINIHAPTVFFDTQLMLGCSAAVLALLLFGWSGLLVGGGALSVTVVRWGHAVVHHPDADGIQPLAPGDQHLAVDQAVVDAVQHPAHAGVPRWTRMLSRPFCCRRSASSPTPRRSRLCR